MDCEATHRPSKTNTGRTAPFARMKKLNQPTNPRHPDEVTTMKSKTGPDPSALRLTEMAFETLKPDAAVLFGSRARGDQEEHRSDVDIMLIVETEPGPEAKDSQTRWAQTSAESIYGRPVPVQLVWLDRKEYEEQERYVNTVVTRALREGVVMAPSPDEYRSRYDDEETQYQYTWTDYDNRLYHAEQHLFSFLLHDDINASDLLIGQQAHSTLEHGLKAAIAGHGAVYPETHNIGNLIGRLREVDPRMANFALDIHPDVYTEYAGKDEYKDQRRRPLLTDHPGYRDATATAAEQLLNLARQLGPNSPPTG